MISLFQDRREAGQVLAEKLQPYANRADVMVLGLPRGGMPVAFEIAQTLNAPLEVFVVRKLGVPDYEELAMGAIASGGARVINQDIVAEFAISSAELESVIAREQIELERREQLYRNAEAMPDLKGRVVILVDDGLATGATMRAAVAALRAQQPAQIIVAVPVAPPDVCQLFQRLADECVCTLTIEPFDGVGRWYRDFSQITDEEVRECLRRAARKSTGIAAKS
ncbi:MAG: phosphoribosyltransferase [Acidobacteriota bacterium]